MHVGEMYRRKERRSFKVEKGKGVAVDESGKEHEITPGESLFVKPNEKHQFKNTSDEPLEIVCIIPNPELRMC